MKQIYEKQICLDLSNSTPYKKKKNLIDLFTNSGIKVSFILNKNVGVLVKNDRNDIDTYKCRTAFKLGIPVVHCDYIIKSINNESVHLKDYIIANMANKENFKQGKITKSK
jgi:hypothetical protein